MARVIIDANLLVLLIVGNSGPHLIGAHKRLSEYKSGDYDTLVQYLEKYDQVVILPNTLTEASNLARQMDGPAKEIISEALQAIGAGFPEVYVQSSIAVARSEHSRLGVTDCALLSALSEGDDSLITVDLSLYIAAVSCGLNAENFNHLRVFDD